jgi:hypothetical protein
VYHLHAHVSRREPKLIERSAHIRRTQDGIQGIHVHLEEFMIPGQGANLARLSNFGHTNSYNAGN